MSPKLEQDGKRPTQSVRLPKAVNGSVDVLTPQKYLDN